MVDQWKGGIARPAVDRAFVLEYADMLRGRSSKLSRSACLRLGRKDSPKVRLLPESRVPQICSVGGLEGQRVVSTSGQSIFQKRTSTSGIAVVQLTSSRVHSPPRVVRDRNPLSHDDCADVVDPRTDSVSVNDLETVRSRFGLKPAEVLMHILSIGESAL